MGKTKTVRFAPDVIAAYNRRCGRVAKKKKNALVPEMAPAIRELIDCEVKEAASEDDESLSYSVDSDLIIKFTETRNIVCHVYTVNSSVPGKRFAKTDYRQLANGIVNATRHQNGLCVMVTPPPRNAEADVMCVIYLCAVKGAMLLGRITKQDAVRARLFTQNVEDVMYHGNLTVLRRCCPPSRAIPTVQVLYMPLMWHLLFDLDPDCAADTVCCGAMSYYFTQVLKMSTEKKTDLWNCVFSEFMPKIHKLCETTGESEASGVETADAETIKQQQ